MAILALAASASLGSWVLLSFHPRNGHRQLHAPARLRSCDSRGTLCFPTHRAMHPPWPAATQPGKHCSTLTHMAHTDLGCLFGAALLWFALLWKGSKFLHGSSSLLTSGRFLSMVQRFQSGVTGGNAVCRRSTSFSTAFPSSAEDPPPTKDPKKQTALASGKWTCLKDSASIRQHYFLVFVLPHSILKQKVKMVALPVQKSFPKK